MKNQKNKATKKKTTNKQTNTNNKAPYKTITK